MPFNLQLDELLIHRYKEIMNREYCNSFYTTVSSNDRKQGYAAVDLYCLKKDEKQRVARVAFWDASGQFFLETFNVEVPLDIIEELVAEAKTTIKTA
ncbi:MAG: hypothetical protein JWR26_1995 [Pedosphaera sp.]|nr:hypothetical protein [Pedosphaera sp.]